MASRRGRHRRPRQRHLPLSAVVGSVTICLAVTGTLVTQPAGAVDGPGDVVLAIEAPSRPAVTSTPGPASVSAQGEDPFAELSLATDHLAAVTEGASTSLHEQIRAAEEKQREEDERKKREQERKEAEERAARERAERERLARMYTAPVSDYRISSHFGGYRGHGGIDLAGPYGQPVRAVHSGTVTFTGWDGSYGYKVVVEHADGTETWYAHLASISVGLGPVTTGAQLGTLGSTGNSTGPHLHLEVRLGGDNRVDPWPWLANKGVRL